MSNSMKTLPNQNDADVITAGSGSTWRGTICVYSNNISPHTELSEATPCNAELLTWAAKPENQPPQTWWDEECDPFEHDE